MSQQDLLNLVIEALDRAGISYMLTGSLASSLQGEPRLTHDIDLVVAIRQEDVAGFCQSFPPPRYYLDRDAVKEAIARESMFNLIDLDEGDKADFWVLTNQPFDLSRFSRRCVENVLNRNLCVSSPEDTILAKLRWAALSGGSEKHFQDALRVFEVQRERLDMKHLNDWAVRLGIEDLWKRIRREWRDIEKE
ncbi:MAG: hypothetical protein NTW86_07995 [Candidatus Sumerlaeota bacterium]|nr:hypothetical protein [Candidatus Sumerlaeota bacterium]